MKAESEEERIREIKESWRVKERIMIRFLVNLIGVLLIALGYLFIGGMIGVLTNHSDAGASAGLMIGVGHILLILNKNLPVVKEKLGS